MDDIYKAPNSESPDDLGDSKPSRKHTLGIWTVSITYLFFSAYALLSLSFILSGFITLAEDGREYVENLRIADYIALFGIPLTEAVAALTFLLRRKICIYFWLSAMAFNLYGYLLVAIDNNWALNITVVGALGFTLRIGTLICISFYTSHLSRIKALK